MKPEDGHEWPNLQVAYGLPNDQHEWRLQPLQRQASKLNAAFKFTTILLKLVTNIAFNFLYFV